MKLTSKTIDYTVQTVDDLLVLAGEENQVVVVTEEGRGGTFIYRSTNSAVNNGGTIFNGWTRQYDGAVNVKWFGAVGDGVTDDTIAFQSSLILGATEVLGVGTYLITDELNLGGLPLNIIGNSVAQYSPTPTTQVVLKFSPSADNKTMFKNFNAKGARVKNLSFEGPTNSQDATTREITEDINTDVNLFEFGGNGSPYFAEIENLTIRHFHCAFKYIEQTYNWSHISNIKLGYCKFGFSYQGGVISHMARFEKIHFANCETGIMGVSEDYNIDGGGMPRYTEISNCVFEFIKYGIYAGSGYNSKAPIIIDSCWFEQVATDAWYIQDMDVTEVNNHFSTVGNTGTVLYGTSRTASNRRNLSELSTGQLVASSATFDKLTGGTNIVATESTPIYLGEDDTNIDINELSMIKTYVFSLAPAETFLIPLSGYNFIANVKAIATGSQNYGGVINVQGYRPAGLIFETARNGLTYPTYDCLSTSTLIITSNDASIVTYRVTMFGTK